MQGVVPHKAIAPLLQEHFVALASDCDDPEEEVVQVAMQLEGAMMLPFVLFTDADGKFLEGSSGLVDPKRFHETLVRLGG